MQIYVQGIEIIKKKTLAHTGGTLQWMQNRTYSASVVRLCKCTHLSAHFSSADNPERRFLNCVQIMK
jgi:hypothetical protein